MNAKRKPRPSATIRKSAVKVVAARKGGARVARPAARVSAEPAKASPDHPARERIIEGARQHFFAHGFRGVTMDDLAQELAMSKKTLYAHFTSKLELVEAVMREKLGRAMRDMERITGDDSHDFASALHELLACMQEHTREITPPFVRDIKREAPQLFAIVEQGRREMITRHFGKLFAQGKKEGRVRKDVPPELIVEILLAATTAIVNPVKMTEMGLSPREGYLGIVTVVLEGALVPEVRGN
ncbi:TetR/AcrR family transcriptional regulator [Roseimicrobium sp. ORNL1]|uniref:TetR/AcrR family transcriptional regulator n=1 Tax=Roseimicrobium sp. ORNL1 TaxID=2711231 RepID=UPI0013E1F27F|nr:TetR/AcrR family transcriptional regulator [Roseimicrobium sp. ORNL1]QIF01837.1 TetR/AcrR family transcriptional regulator [Roseimicrobium sp. ORNL1]